MSPGARRQCLPVYENVETSVQKPGGPSPAAGPPASLDVRQGHRAVDARARALVVLRQRVQPALRRGCGRRRRVAALAGRQVYLRPLTLAPHSRPPARLPQPDGEAPRGVRSSSSLPYLPPLPPRRPPPSRPFLPSCAPARTPLRPPAGARQRRRRAAPGVRVPVPSGPGPGCPPSPSSCRVRGSAPASPPVHSSLGSSPAVPSRPVSLALPLPSTAPPAPSPPLSCPALPAFPLSFLAAARLPTAARPGTLPRSPGRDRQVPGAARPPSAPPRPRGLGAEGAWGPGRPPPAHSGAAGGRAGCQPPGGL